MEMTTAKTVAVFAIIFGCFAVLYPKIFHPMFMHLFSSGSSNPKQDDISMYFTYYILNFNISRFIMIKNDLKIPTD